MRTVPRSARMAVARTRSRVDFPEPLRPVTITSAPSGTSKPTSVRAQRRPYRRQRPAAAMAIIRRMLLDAGAESEFRADATLATREAAHESIELRCGLLDGLARTGQLEEHVSAWTFGDSAEEREVCLGRLRSSWHPGAECPFRGNARHADSVHALHPAR